MSNLQYLLKCQCKWGPTVQPLAKFSINYQLATPMVSVFMKSKYNVSVDFTFSGDILFEILSNEISLKNISLVFFNERIILG